MAFRVVVALLLAPLGSSVRIVRQDGFPVPPKKLAERFCLSQDAHLACESQETISIYSAFYNRRKDEACGPPAVPTAEMKESCAANFTQQVLARCNDKSECTLPPSMHPLCTTKPFLGSRIVWNCLPIVPVEEEMDQPPDFEDDLDLPTFAPSFEDTTTPAERTTFAPVLEDLPTEPPVTTFVPSWEKDTTTPAEPTTFAPILEDLPTEPPLPTFVPVLEKDLPTMPATTFAPDPHPVTTPQLAGLDDLPDSVKHSENFCTSLPMDLTCPRGSGIKLYSAFYNTRRRDSCVPATGSCSGEVGTPLCGCAPNATDMVLETCSTGSSVCHLQPELHRFCEQRPFTFMRVVWYCVKGLQRTKNVIHELVSGKQTE